MSASSPAFASWFLNAFHSEWEESLVDSHCILACISLLVSDIKHFVWIGDCLFYFFENCSLTSLAPLFVALFDAVFNLLILIFCQFYS